MAVRTTSFGLLAASLLAGVLIGPTVHASAPNEAEALFEKGLEDMLAERYETGCPALSDSHYLDPLPGVTFTLAECYAKWGKVATARKHYRTYLDSVAQMSEAEQAAQTERVEISQTQLADLDKRIPVLVLNLPAEQREGVTVRVDGLPFQRFGSEQDLDPGEHTVVLRTADGQSSEEVVELSEGERREIQLEPPESADTPPPTEPTALDGDAMRIAGWTAGAVGAAGLLVGFISGGVALGEKSAIEDNCVGHACNPDGLDAAESGQTAAAVSTVGFIVGAVGLATGATLLLLAPSDEPASDEPAEPADATIGFTFDGAPGPHPQATFGVKGTW